MTNKSVQRPDEKQGLSKKPLQDTLLQDTLLQGTGLWRASSIDYDVKEGVPSGFGILDRHLPGAGWPESGVTELLFEQSGIGELRLLAPALAHLSQSQNRWLLWVSPPYVPYPPALFQAGIDMASVLIVKPKTIKDTLWVLEKALASRSCSAVLAWPGNINEKQIRRLQLASKEGNSWNVLFRPTAMVKHSSPAELRIQLYPVRTSELITHTSIDLKIIKRRGGWATEVINVPFSDKLNQPTPVFRELDITAKRTGADHLTADDLGHRFPSTKSFQNTDSNGPELQ
jgi:cell division inhibitor SulA